MPRSALLAAALLAVAGGALDARDEDELREVIRPLGRAVGAGGVAERQRRSVASWPMPPLLRQCLLSVIPSPGESWRWIAVRGSMAGIDRSWDRKNDLAGHQLPRVVSAADYAELVAPWLRTDEDRPGHRFSALAGRRFAALSLARLSGARAGLMLLWFWAGASAVVREWATR
jgi:hypothetical protein